MSVLAVGAAALALAAPAPCDGRPDPVPRAEPPSPRLGRQDRARVLDRYGPLGVARILARRPYRLECVPLSTYETLDDGRTLRLIWTTNSAYDFVEVVVAEDAETVWIGIVERVPTGPVTLMAQTRDELLWLSAGVGGRTVRDAATGRAVRPQG